jgi:quercetin dioxygenase-like cupin family protein
MTRAMRWSGILASLAIVTECLAGASAEQAPAGRRSVGRATSLGVEGDRFTRTRWEPGGRTNWHIHPRGQIILAQEGRVRVQVRGRPIIELIPGDEPVYTPPNVAHWHGAAPDESGTYLATTPGGEADVQWLEEVTDPDYAAAALPGKKPAP